MKLRRVRFVETVVAGWSTGLELLEIIVWLVVWFMDVGTVWRAGMLTSVSGGVDVSTVSTVAFDETALDGVVDLVGCDGAVCEADAI